MLLIPGASPPATTPRINDEVAAVCCLASVKSPKSCAFPKVAMVT